MNKPPENRQRNTYKQDAKTNHDKGKQGIVMLTLSWFIGVLNDSSMLAALGTVVIAVFTVVLAVATIELKKTSQEQTRNLEKSVSIARTSSERQLRAWMGDLDIRVAGPLVMKDEKASITLFISFKNVGNSPTLETNIAAELVPIGQRWEDIQRQICEGSVEPKKERGWAGRYVVAPGDRFSAQPYPTMQLDIEGQNEFVPMIVGCVFYGLASEDGLTPHRTGFVASISMKGPGASLNRPLPIKANDGNISPNRLVIVRKHTSGYVD